MDVTTEPVQDEQSALAAIMTEVYAESATSASKFGGGSLLAEASRDPHEVEADLGKWYPYLAPRIRESRPKADISSLPQLGPLETGAIHFDSGAPVRGWAQLTLFQTGVVNFSGHFHDSGATSYDVSLAVAVRSQAGVLYAFGSAGHMAGTFEPGSRDFNWGREEHRDAVRDDWANIAVNSTWWWHASVNLNLASSLEAVKNLAQTVGAVGAVIVLL